MYKLTREQQEQFLTRLHSPDLRLELDPSPTTMGPGYVASKIAEILSAKSIVNDMAEQVELALCSAQTELNDLEEDIRLRTDLAYNDLDPEDVRGKDAAGKKAYISAQVESDYVKDKMESLQPGDTPPSHFQLTQDILTARNTVVDLKALLSILDRRRDHLAKLDSGVRLQQKTMETEVSIYGKGGQPSPAAPINTPRKPVLEQVVTQVRSYGLTEDVIEGSPDFYGSGDNHDSVDE